MTGSRVLVTGAAGFIGAQVVDRLAGLPEVAHVVSVDVRAMEGRHGVSRHELDVRDPALVDLVVEQRVDRIVHLAAVVTPRPDQTREFLYSVDVEGTSNVLAACGTGAVNHLTVTSSGAAYGYHPDNPEWIDENDQLRGNAAFAYSDHKRILEEMLAAHRSAHPEVEQLVLRPGTILGASVANQITRLFEWPVVLGIAGSPSPFVFIWDADVVEVIVRGTLEKRTGIFNLAGSGAVPMRDLAGELGKRYVPLPATVVRAVLAVLHRLRLAPYGPEQVDFLRYRPVLSNRRLIEEFGYTPTKTSLEAFRSYLEHRG
ncbi:MAG: SDR family oxidoreductase [Acidimicrobiia bacterium]|nr:SDR family oxidoreductase [Acidimicrobiia bacterium]